MIAAAIAFVVGLVVGFAILVWLIEVTLKNKGGA